MQNDEKRNDLGDENHRHLQQFGIRIDETIHHVSDPEPTGRFLLGLADKSPETHILTIVLPGVDDEIVGADEVVDLRKPGRERFTVVRKPHCTDFELDIEGKIIPWHEPTITSDQVAELGGWNLSEGVIFIDAEQNERQLQPGEVISLTNGACFSRKVRFRRG